MRRCLLLFALPLLAEPRLLLNTRDLERIRQTVDSDPAAKALVDDLLQRAARWPASHVREYGLREWALPTEGGGWSHAYVCPEHGVRLRQSLGKNLCPVDGKDYHGYPIDNVAFSQRHISNAQAVRDLGLAYRLTADREFAEKARVVCRAYARLYPTLPIHDNNNKLDTRSGARVMSQTLSESSWLMPLIFGYDLIRDSLSPPEREEFETNVLRNAARVIARNNMGKSNWQSWHNAALLAVGLTVDDKALVDLAVRGPAGFDFQMRESITADGPWFEGAWGYHFFSIDPLMLTVEMARRAGIALPSASALQRMLDAPERAVFPDGTLPNFNDSNLVKLPERRKPFDRLLWGDSPFLARPVDRSSSDLMPDAGIATLRVRGSDHTLAVKFGPHGGGHGHNDKLNFISFANGAHMAADAGTQAYAAKSHATWDKTTVAHNTVVIDETSQAQATGKLLSWTALPDVSAIHLDAGPVYASARLRRTMVHTADYTLDLFDVQSKDGKPHRIDWLHHNYSPLLSVPGPDAAPVLPAGNGYQHLSASGAATSGAPWEFAFEHMQLYLLGCPSTTAITGKALGPDLRVPLPFLLARRDATETRFEALYEPFRKEPVVRAFRRITDGRYRIEFAKRVDEISAGEGGLQLLRTNNGNASRLVLHGVARHALLEREFTAPIEINWSDDGSTVDIDTHDDGRERLRVRAPRAVRVRWNGVPAACRIDGDFRVITSDTSAQPQPCR